MALWRGIPTNVKVRVVGVGNYNEFLVLALQLRERIFAHVALLWLLAVRHHDGAFDLVSGLQQVGAQTRKAWGGVPIVAGVYRELVETGGGVSFMLCVVVQQELRDART